MFATLLIPATPGWSQLHPLVVHFPVALLMVAPLFVLGGQFMDSKRARPYFIAGWLLMLGGTCGTFVAGATGDAASEAASKTPAIQVVLEQHEEMAETTQIVFGVLTVVFATFLFLPRILHKELRLGAVRSLMVLFLLAYLGGVGLLGNTAHDGGRLVHELGIHSGTGTAATAAVAQPDRDLE